MLSSSLIVLLVASSFVNGLPSSFRREVHDVASVPGLGALANIPRADAVVAPLDNATGRKIKRDFTTLEGAPEGVPVVAAFSLPFPTKPVTDAQTQTPATFSVPFPTKPVTDAQTQTPATFSVPFPTKGTGNIPSTLVDAPAQDPISFDQVDSGDSVDDEGDN